ncbi:MAG TPA: hypothetical protein VF503_30575 [Sphingobium sp.]
MKFWPAPRIPDENPRWATLEFGAICTLVAVGILIDILSRML